MGREYDTKFYMARGLTPLKFAKILSCENLIEIGQLKEYASEAVA